jgi:cell division septum initiation protein DivIVA
MQEAFKKVEKDAFRFAADNEKLKKQIESLESEIANLRKDAEVMRSLLERSTLVPTEPAKEKAQTKAVPAKVEAEQLSAFDEAPIAEEPTVEQPVAPVPAAVTAPEAETAPAPAEETVPAEDATSKKNQKTGKNRVGNMFDMLIYSDV